MSEDFGEFLDLFRDEADERLGSMVDALLALEGGEGGRAAVDSLFRDAHTIKGGAGMLRLTDLHAYAHAVEDVLEGVRATGDFPTELAEPLLRAVDVMRHQFRGDGVNNGASDLLEELERHTRAHTGEAPSKSEVGFLPPHDPGRAVLRRPLGRTPARQETLAGAVLAASEGRRVDALAGTAALLAAQPLDADAAFVRGLVLLESGLNAEAVKALRRALYIDPTFGLAAFQLGRAYDELGDTTAAKRFYRQALRTLEPEDDRHDLLLGQVDLADIAGAAQARLEVLR